MRAAVIGDDGAFHVETVADPVPGPGELVLRVAGCGICGSDLKARPAMPAGTVMGHELSGEVVAVGPGAGDTWREGMQAAVLPVFSCGRCPHCRAGDVAHCAEAALTGLGGGPGGFAELTLARADLAFPLPSDLPAACGPLVEPFAVGLHTARIAAVGAGDHVLVIGAGPVGLTTAWWARELGAETVTVSDPVARRRDAAPAFGATATLDPATLDPGAGGSGGPYDVVIECVGKPGLLDVCAGAARTHGRVVVAGVCAEPDPFLPMVALLKELTVRFSVYYRPVEFRTVVDAFARGRIDPMTLVTSTVGFADVDAAFAALASSPDELKVLVDPTIGPTSAPTTATPDARPQEEP